MRRCVLQRSVLALRTRSCRTLGTSPRPQPRAIKQLSNAELLKLVQEGNADTTSTPDHAPSETGTETHDDLPQSSSRLSAWSPPSRSPLIEPRLVAARARYRREKPPPCKDRSPFQLKLEKNPYAQALSTPPRLCLLTGIRLPSYFLIPFGIAKHPKTGSTWHLPRLSSLASGSDASTTAPPPGSDSGSTSKQPSRTATGTHYVGSYEALAYISDLAKPAYRKLIPFRWKEDSSLKVSDMVWREDMASFVLEMLRKSITQDLKYLASRPAAYIVACEIHERISAHDQIAAVLWLGPNGDTSTQGPPLDGAANPEEPDPPPYAMDHYKDRLVPCFNLVALLEHTHLRTLRETAPIQYGDKLAVIKAKRPTVKVQLELWKLLGFLAHRTGDAMKNAKGD